MKDSKYCTRIQLMQLNTQLGSDGKSGTVAVVIRIIVMVAIVLYQVVFRHYSNFYNNFMNSNKPRVSEKTSDLTRATDRVSDGAKIQIQNCLSSKHISYGINMSLQDTSFYVGRETSY